MDLRNIVLRLTSVALAAWVWYGIVGFSDYPPDAWWNSIVVVRIATCLGAVAAALTKPVTKSLLLVHLFTLVLSWLAKDGFV